MRTTEEESTYLGTLVYDEDDAAYQTLTLPVSMIGVIQCSPHELAFLIGHIQKHCEGYQITAQYMTLY